jgi:UDP-N-acetylglucosamine/UDP-N-acetyl-alpha-D-glucosaminouronate 4-epimerase
MLPSNTRCLVTGGAGFIGSNLTDRLVADGHDVRVVDNLSTGHLRNLDSVIDHIHFIEGDLCDVDVVAQAVDGVDTVFHIAALPSVPRSLADPWGSHDANVNATVRLLQGCVDAGVRRCVYSSSSSVYGDTPTLPKVEAVEPLPRSPYAAAKLSGEQYVLAFARAGLVEGVALRYFNVFGPRQDPHSAYAAVIPAFMAAARDRTSAHINGDGEQTRDFTYVDNVVNANLLGASQASDRVNGQVFNVGAGSRTSLLELLRLIEEVAGYSVDHQHAPPRPGDVRDSLAGLERAGRGLGYQPSVSLKAGLELTWRWIVESEQSPVGGESSAA